MEKPNCLIILIPVVEGMITVTVSSPLLYFQFSPFEDMENSRCSFKWGWEDQISSASLHGTEPLRTKAPVLKGEMYVRPSTSFHCIKALIHLVFPTLKGEHKLCNSLKFSIFLNFLKANPMCHGPVKHLWVMNTLGKNSCCKKLVCVSQNTNTALQYCFLIHHIFWTTQINPHTSQLRSWLSAPDALIWALQWMVACQSRLQGIAWGPLDLWRLRAGKSGYSLMA